MSKGSKKNVGVVLSKSGASFRVWAPFASSVAVSGTFNNWGETPLESENDGYWYVEIKDAKAGQEYKFVIRNSDMVLKKNDPRARQITANAGNSVIVDNDFDWESEEDFNLPPIEQQVIYELHVGTFNRSDASTVGTFENAIEKLDYLKDLGITTIELMPVTSMSADQPWWGYTPEYIYSVENLYGGRHQLLEFVKQAHKKGIGVILDVVYNHFGPGRDMDLWQFDGWQQDGKGGIYFYNDWRSSTPWGDTRPDYGRSEVRQFLLDNVKQWLTDFHLDGLRVDSTIFIRNGVGHNDDPGSDISEGWYFLQDLTKLVRKINPNALVIAEDIGVNHYLTKPVDVGGAGFAAQWQVTLPHLIHNALDVLSDGDRDIGSIAHELERSFNGDSMQKVVYSDSHDSAANGAARLNSEISPDNPTSLYARQRSLLAAGLILTAPGIPMLLQGQEFMQGGSFNDWQELDWKRTESLAGMVDVHKHLIALRKNQGGVSAGLTGRGLEVIQLNDQAKVLAYKRYNNGGPKDECVVVANFSNTPYQEYSLGFPRNGLWRLRFNSGWSGYSPDFKKIEVPDVNVTNNAGTVVLPPYSLLILSQDD